MPIRSKLSTKRFGTDANGNGVVILPVTDTEAVKSTKLINADGSAKSLQQMIDEGIIGGSQAATTDSVISTHETDATGNPKTLQQILEELEASSGTLTIDETLDKSSTRPVQNKTLANILIFT